MASGVMIRKNNTSVFELIKALSWELWRNRISLRL